MLLLNFHPFPLLETERFVLRQMTINDIHEVFTLRSDDKVNEFLDRPKANSLEDVRKFIDKITTGISNNECLYWVIVPKNETQLVGTICFWNISKENYRAEIGYELLTEHTGKGIMQEVITKVIEFGFSSMKLRSIEASLTADNHKSVSILERNSFKRDAEAERKIDRENEPDNLVIYLLQNSGK
jgi:ribosomal-protein-alanine N-acetyltransferase